MADFGKGKIGERNKRKIANFGREKLEMTSLQADLIGRERIGNDFTTSRFDRKGKR